jgi:hypothetical protein
MATVRCVRLVAFVGMLVVLLAACRPVLPPEMVSALERLPLHQQIAGASRMMWCG